MNESPLSEQQLENLIDRQLRGLPTPKAPSTLGPRVLAAIAAQNARPWWQRAWVFWPRHLQIIFVATIIGVTATAAWFFGGVDFADLAVQGKDLLAAKLSFARPLAVLVAGLGNYSVHAIRSVNPTVWIVTASFLAFTYATCISLGTFCYRMAARSYNS